MTTEFVHLQVHSDLSLIDSTIKINKLVKKAKEYGMTALALTDYMNLFGAVKFYKACRQQGIKPIIGAELAISRKKDTYTMLVLAKNTTGYKNIIKLISGAYQVPHEDDHPLIQEGELTKYNDGIIAILTRGSMLARIDDESKLQQEIDFYQSIFQDNLYLGVSILGFPKEQEYFLKIAKLSNKFNIPAVALNDAKFLAAKDFDAHITRVAIHDKVFRNDILELHKYSKEQNFKSKEAMELVFANFTELLTNTVEVAKRCNVEIELGKFYLPRFPMSENLTEAEYLIKIANEGLRRRLKFHYPNKYEELLPKYQVRLDYELGVIERMGFPGYFLIVMEFINWSKNNGVPVGPGRGSGAGSLVAYSIAITDLDPIELDLIFERFLNEERVSMPDFDVDFGMDERDLVIEHVSDLYGRDAVAQIVTFGTLAAKAALRDVGRVFGYGYNYVDQLAKLIPTEPGMTFDKALKNDDFREVYETDDEAKVIIDEAMILEGVSRNVGKHAGGVVIAPTAITDFSALYYDSEGKHPITQYYKSDIEAVGLVKFDFLGLRTLSIIKWALNDIEKVFQEKLDLSTIPLNDKSSFDMMKNGYTVGVFQLESAGMTKLIMRLQPDRFDEIIALVALFRPGPLESGMVDNYIDRKKGIEKVSYPDKDFEHISLKPILDDTYGVILYQEQVMQIAQVLAGYSLGSADLLRRAMGKKLPEEMAKQRSVFESGAIQNGIDGNLAMKIFDLVEKFAGYGFNKSHSAAYALVAYQTLWLKTHYSSAFMAATLSSEVADFDKLVPFIEETKRLGVTILPPTIQGGRFKFITVSKDEVLYGLGAIKGVGEDLAENIYKEFLKAPFQDMLDFVVRILPFKLNKRNLERLIKAGALDCFSLNRASLVANIDSILKLASEKINNAKASFLGDFGIAEETKYIEINEYSTKELLEFEKEVLGFYFRTSPVDRYKQELRTYGTKPIAQLQPDSKVLLGGMISQVRNLRTKAGKKMAVITLDDGSGKINIVLFEKTLEKFALNFTEDMLILIKGSISIDPYDKSLKVTATDIRLLDDVRLNTVKEVGVKLTSITADNIQAFKGVLQKYSGTIPLNFLTKQDEKKLILTPEPNILINPSTEFVHDLEKVLGEQSVQLFFKQIMTNQ